MWRRQPTVCSFQTAEAAAADGVRFYSLDGRVHFLLHCKHVFAIVDAVKGASCAPLCACELMRVVHERAVRWAPGTLPRLALHVRLPDSRHDEWDRPAVLHCRLECAWSEGTGRLFSIMETDVPTLQKQWQQVLEFQRCDCNWQLRRRVIAALQHAPCALRHAIVSFV